MTQVTFPTSPQCGSTAIDVRLRYDSDHPHTVAFVFLPPNQGPITWLCDREMLRDGLSRVVGQGDIRITPGALTVGVHVGPGRQKAEVIFARDDLALFLDTTYRVVPDGTEHVDLSELDRLLEGS